MKYYFINDFALALLLLNCISISLSDANSGIMLVGNFTYCDVRNEKGLVNMNMKCESLKSSSGIGLFGGRKYDILVMAKLNFVIDTYGTECYMKKVIRYLNTSFFGVRSESIFYVEIQLTPIECIAMIESHKCNSHLMKCSDDGCSFDELPEGEFAWFQDVKLTTLNCKLHRRKVQGEKNTSRLFSNSRSSCLPPDLYCQMPSSIIVWQSSDVKQFMYSYIHRGNNYTLKGTNINHMFIFKSYNKIKTK